MKPSRLHFWAQLKDGPRVLHPADAAYVHAFNKDAGKTSKLRTNLVPEPAFGRRDAPVVLLLLNPGVGKTDARFHRQDSYRQALLRAVRQPRPRTHFHLVGPEDAPGTQWWMRACRPLIDLLGLDAVAQNILSVEYSAYHSTSFAHGHLRLPSQEFGFALVDAAVNRGALIICMRGERFWKGAVPRLVGYKNFCALKNPRSSTLSARNVKRHSELVARLRSA